MKKQKTRKLSGIVAGKVSGHIPEVFTTNKKMSAVALGLIIVTLAIGIPIAIFHSLAATGIASLEPEDGLLSGPASAGSDTGASRGGYVSFGAGGNNGSVTFPLHISTDKHHFEDSSGKPFLVNGEAAWSLIVQLNQAQVKQYLDDRQSKGINTIMVNLIEHHFANNPPKDIYNNAPFTTANDYSTPNEAYFANADWVIGQAEQRGIEVLLAPSYAGNGGGDEGWYNAAMVSNGTNKLYNYGKYVATRLGSHKNILWENSGDYTPPNKALVDAIARGVSDTLANTLQTAHSSSYSDAYSEWHNYSWYNINNVYTYDDVYEPTLSNYSTAIPTIMIESFYEDEYGTTAAQVRKQMYYPVLAGGAGALFGNGTIWCFNASCFYPNGTWQSNLSRPGSLGAQYFGKLFRSRDWHKLVPDTNSSVLTAGGGAVGSASYAAAARTSDGHTIIVYTPSQKALTVNLTKVSGTTVRAWWYNAATGQATDAGAYATTGSQSFTPPASGDWALVIDDASLGLAAPGS